MNSKEKREAAKTASNTTPSEGTKTISLNDIEIDLKLGRPVNPNSERQKRLADMETKRNETGTLHRGRPRDPNSANAKKQEIRDARILEMKMAKAKELGLEVIDVTAKDMEKAEELLGETGISNNKISQVSDTIEA